MSHTTKDMCLKSIGKGSQVWIRMGIVSVWVRRTGSDPKEPFVQPGSVHRALDPAGCPVATGF